MRKMLALIFVLTLFAVPAMAADVAQDAPAPVTENVTVDKDFFDTLNGAVETSNHCVKRNPDEDCICPAVWDPVCGCDGNTYSNSCFADCKVRSWTAGECGSTS